MTNITLYGLTRIIINAKVPLMLLALGHKQSMVHDITEGEIPYECRPLQQVFPELLRIEVPRRRRHELTSSARCPAR